MARKETARNYKNPIGLEKQRLESGLRMLDLHHPTMFQMCRSVRPRRSRRNAQQDASSVAQ